jgi:uncharacterized protein (DUF488 family)
LAIVRTQLQSPGRTRDRILALGNPTVWTIGHSTRDWPTFLGLLEENRIERLVDVRHYPSSTRVPWTNRDTLQGLLADRGIGYEHLVNLGGYRKPNPSSTNTGLRNASFRGYADYMTSEEFGHALDRLLSFAESARTTVLCAEAVPWRCHRFLLSDALVAHGARVVHILGSRQTQDHRLNSAASVRAGRISYTGKA